MHLANIQNHFSLILRFSVITFLNPKNSSFNNSRNPVELPVFFNFSTSHKKCIYNYKLEKKLRVLKFTSESSNPSTIVFKFCMTKAYYINNLLDLDGIEFETFIREFKDFK